MNPRKIIAFQISTVYMTMLEVTMNNANINMNNF